MGYLTAHREGIVHVLLAVLILVGTWVVVGLMRRGVERFVFRRDIASRDPGVLTKFRMIEQLLAAVLIFVGVAFALVTVNYPPLRNLAVGMFASASLAGIILGLAAQTTVANLVSGIVIAFVQPLRLRDWVVVSEEQGEVEQIGLFYTQIRTWDNRRVVIPNKVLSNEVIRNSSIRDPRTPAMVTFRLDYGTDLDRARSLLLAEAEADPRTLTEPTPWVRILDADEKGVRLRMAAWATDPIAAWELGFTLGENAMAALEVAGMTSSGYALETPPAGLPAEQALD